MQFFLIHVQIIKTDGPSINLLNFPLAKIPSPRVSSTIQEVPDFTSLFISVNSFESKPLKGLRVGIILETIGDGVDQTVISSINAVAAHLEDLGCSLVEVSLPSFSLGLLAYYILDASESSSNLSCCDGIRSDFFKCATTE
ncbi:hypothetical protein Dimus_017922 [Dionaea muscipula]